MALTRPDGVLHRVPRLRMPLPAGRLAKRHRTRGQSMVEFVLVLPVLFLLLGAAIDLGRLFYSDVAVQNAAKEGALAGSRQPLCDAPGLPICTDPNNVVWHVNNEAPNLVNGSGQSLMNTTVACRQPDGTLVQSITDCLDGYTYQVTVSMPFQLITPLLSSVMSSNFTLTKEAQATVVTDAFDPSGLEVLMWASTSNSLNSSEITSSCTPADAINSPGYYYQPCQDGSNVDHYLQYSEGQTVSYKVRVRNTGNIALSNITYAFAENSLAFSTPSSCSSALPTTLAANSAPVYCSFTRTAVVTNAAGGTNDDIVSIQTSAKAAGLPAGVNATNTDVKVVPAPRLAVNLLASPWRLGGLTGNGSNGSPSFATGNLTLDRDTSSSSTEIQNPTGWLYLSVQNQGGPASNFTVGVTRAGSAVSLPAWCTVPTSLATAGQAGDTFTCAIPQSFTTIATTGFAATASATNSQTVGGTQPNVNVTTSTCSGGQKVVPNLVDTLSPPANDTTKTVTQDQAIWTAAGFTGALTTNPAGAAGTTTVSAQSQTAYTCQPASGTVTVAAP
jgi:Flp pilus assembly protein TadG